MVNEFTEILERLRNAKEQIIDYCGLDVLMKWVGFPRTDPFFTDLSGLTLQSGVGVGPGGRLVKDEYTVGGGGTAAAAAAAAVGSAMDVDGEMNQTIQHHPPAPQSTASNNAQQAQQGFIPGLPTPNPSKLNVR